MKRFRATEDSFIYEFIKTYYGTGNQPALKGFLEKCDYNRLTRRLKRYGIIGFFYKALLDRKVDLIIHDYWLGQWKRLVGEFALCNALYEKEGAKLLKDLQEIGMNPILLKGFTRMDLLYGDLWQRPVSDLDIYICKEDYPVLRDYLLNHGFNYAASNAFTNITEEQAFISVNLQNETHFTKALGRLTFNLDVHRDIATLWLAPLEEMYALNHYPWSRYTEKMQLGGTEVNCLNIEMHYIHSILHFALHNQFTGAKWLIDLCQFTVKMDEQLNWTFIKNIVADVNCQKAFDVALQLVAEFTGDEGPAARWRETYRGRYLPCEYGFYKRRLFAADKSPLTIYLCHMLLPHRFRDKFKVLFFILFNSRAFPRRQAFGKKTLPLLQPFHIIGRILHANRKNKPE